MATQRASGKDRLSAPQERVAAAIAGGMTVAEAAASAEVNERTVWRWLSSEPAFRDRVERNRAAVSARVLTDVVAGSVRAVRVLIDSLSSENEGSRIKAAGLLLQHKLRETEQGEMRKELDAIQSLIREKRS